MERGEDLRELYEIRATIETTAARLAAERRTEAQLSEIDAHQRRIEAAAAEPIALRAAELDFHDAVVEAAHNSLLSHVGAMIRVALEAAGEPPPPDANADEASLRTAVTSAIRAQDPDASEAAMRSLVEMGWRRVVAEDNRRTDDS
jgi:DNA-binding FadR family transcriptional regulator